MAAVIGIPDPKWEERPLLLVKTKENTIISKAEIQRFLAEQVAKWWVPEDIRFVDEIPLTATGKINKLPLRDFYGVNAPPQKIGHNLLVTTSPSSRPL